MTVSKTYTCCINAGQLIVGINCNILIISTFKVWHSIAFQLEEKTDFTTINTEYVSFTKKSDRKESCILAIFHPAFFADADDRSIIPAE